MTTEPSSQARSVCGSLSISFSLTAIGVGILVLVGWAAGIEIFKRVLPGLVTMKANTAIGLILGGLAVWLLQSESVREARRAAGRAAAGIMGVLGFLTLGQYVLGWELGIDQLLFTEPPGDVGTAFPGRMGPNTALTFLLLGGALLSLSVETEKGYRIGQGLALAAWLIPLLAFMGYAYSSVSLYGIASMTQMALCIRPWPCSFSVPPACWPDPIGA